MSQFDKIEEEQLFENFVLEQEFEDDPFPRKVCLVINTYRTDRGQSWVPTFVRDTERSIANDDNLNKNYLPTFGLKSFCDAAIKFLLGENSKAIKENRCLGVQCISGAGSLQIGAMFLARAMNCNVFYTSKPGWDVHKAIFKTAGFQIREYRYWSESKHKLDIIGLLDDLNAAPEKSVIVLQACGHNPTGCDPTQDQWIKIADVVEKRKLIPFFDTVHQGMISGDFEKDAWCVRYFVERGIEILCAQSFSKNLLLYNERVGNLVFVTNDSTVFPKIRAHLVQIVRGMYLSPPAHGARIVTKILTDPILFEEWKNFIQALSSKLKNIRKMLREYLEKINTLGDWSYITTHAGLYLVTGLNEKQSVHMVKKHHIYMVRSGRINLCGLLPANLEYVAKSINETLRDTT